MIEYALIFFLLFPHPIAKGVVMLSRIGFHCRGWANRVLPRLGRTARPNISGYFYVLVTSLVLTLSNLGYADDNLVDVNKTLETLRNVDWTKSGNIEIITSKCNKIKITVNGKKHEIRAYDKDGKEIAIDRLPVMPLPPQYNPKAAFNTLPEVRSIYSSRTEADAGRQSQKDDVKKPTEPCVDVTFSKNCHFPLPGFDRCGKRVDEDGLLIYNDMRFAVWKSGEYELSLTTTQARLPVVLHLQLKLTPHLLIEKYVANDEGSSFTLTIPPIRIDPSDDDRAGDDEFVPRQITHRGYSESLRKLLEDGKGGTKLSTNPKADAFTQTADVKPKVLWGVTRHGSARFGNGVSID